MQCYAHKKARCYAGYRGFCVLMRLYATQLNILQQDTDSGFKPLLVLDLNLAKPNWVQLRVQAKAEYLFRWLSGSV